LQHLAQPNLRLPLPLPLRHLPLLPPHPQFLLPHLRTLPQHPHCHLLRPLNFQLPLSRYYWLLIQTLQQSLSSQRYLSFPRLKQAPLRMLNSAKLSRLL
jgi:hypothetical protein